MDKKTIELATALHGHLAPGVALGLRMSELALSRLNLSKGDKHLLGVCETSRCLADAVQAATGCTLGHGNAVVEDYGKLAVTIADSRNSHGIRVSLSGKASGISPLMEKWMMRQGKLAKDEEKALGYLLLEANESCFDVQEVKVHVGQKFENSQITRCEGCGELIPAKLSIKLGEKRYCKPCAGEGYYTLKKRHC